MTKEERKLALYCLKASSDYHSEVCEECIKYPNCDHMGHDDVTETIIKALEQEPCEDAINRDDAIRIAEQGQIQGFEWEIRKLVTLPPVNPQPKTGHWIDSPNGYFTHCSECGLYGDKGIYKHYGWCPKCGAKMVEPQERSDKE